jgi:2-polyprenyl-3-methyl-5-hydroxy-6-metoxy-1,4-benzoquinol methylase
MLKAERKCRFCNAHLTETFANLGMSPLSNSFIANDKQHLPESIYPLHAYVCSHCFLVQLEEFESPQNIFTDYLYFSSFSDDWLKHSERYANDSIKKFNLNSSSTVVEIASNDGYLLHFFKQRKIPVLGIEPASNVAQTAIAKGIPTEVAFFGVETANQLKEKGVSADLIVANNVLAHVPNINDFVAGFKILLKPAGVTTFEFPSLHRQIEGNQFDTIYHEHFSYLSLLAVEQVMGKHGLRVFDVEELKTHGGSLRVYVSHQDTPHLSTQGLKEQRRREADFGLNNLTVYKNFSNVISTIKADLLEFFLNARKSGKVVAGYGAPAKGNTLLNYCGIGPEFLPFTVDRSPYKQNTLLPGCRIPVLSPDQIFQSKPDYLLILPWNLRNEISAQMSEIRSWGGKFVTPIPKIEVF